MNVFQGDVDVGVFGGAPVNPVDGVIGDVVSPCSDVASLASKLAMDPTYSPDEDVMLDSQLFVLAVGQERLTVDTRCRLPPVSPEVFNVVSARIPALAPCSRPRRDNCKKRLFGEAIVDETVATEEEEENEEEENEEEKEEEEEKKVAVELAAGGTTSRCDRAAQADAYGGISYRQSRDRYQAQITVRGIAKKLALGELRNCAVAAAAVNHARAMVLSVGRRVKLAANEGVPRLTGANLAVVSRKVLAWLAANLNPAPVAAATAPTTTTGTASVRVTAAAHALL